MTGHCFQVPEAQTLASGHSHCYMEPRKPNPSMEMQA
jgi:hypothetical protein